MELVVPSSAIFHRHFGVRRGEEVHLEEATRRVAGEGDLLLIQLARPQCCHYLNIN